MTAHAYATATDVYRECGLGAAAFATRPRALDPDAGDALDFATGTFTLLAHGYEDGDVVRLVQVARGSLPGGATSTPVYATPLDYWRFRLSTTLGGSALTFTSAGSGWGVQRDPEQAILRLSRSCSAIIDECLIAHATPLVAPYPLVVVGVCARMVARRFLPTLMSENPAVRAAADRVLASAALDGDTSPPAQPGSLLGDWKSGKGIYPTPLDQTRGPDNVARANCRPALGFGRGVM